jgi:tetratricopeptide (TPR) repeat protein
MGNIPLRAYNREIEHLIADNRSHEAIGHCQKILDSFPRCLETTRLMGKAYLELQQFDLAEESFHKVLSSIPDDFTANLGMSLLREKQNNLDGTVWHMERAYESQPSNTALQSELRRLYQKRDGAETAKIRLTRGALVRMYLRGDLTSQALQEVEEILREDPSRIDILILKVEALLKTGRKEEALTITQTILQYLPYCYAANRILYENTDFNSSLEIKQTSRQKLCELDPYYAYTSPENADPLKVPDTEILMDNAGIKDAELHFPQEKTPDEFSFSSILKNETSEDENNAGLQGNSFDNDRPDWLKGIEIASFPTESDRQNPVFQPPDSQFPREEIELKKPMSNEEIPPKDETPSEEPINPEGPSELVTPNPFLTSTGNLIPVAEPGDIPEWLRALAAEPPAASSDAITAPLRVPGETGVLQTGEENLDFLKTVPGQQPADGSGNSNQSPVPTDNSPSLIPADPFLMTGETTQPVPIEGLDEHIPTSSQEIPDWLKEVADSPSNAIKPPVVENKPEDINAQFTAPSELTLDENQLISEQQNPEIVGAEIGKEVPSEELEEYLSQLRKDIAPGEQPDWLQKDTLGNDLEALFQEGSKPAAPPSSDESAPSWMDDLKADEKPEVPEETSTAPVSTSSIPEWLFTPETDDEDTSPIDMGEPVTKQPAPDWLRDLQSDEFVESSPEPAGEAIDNINLVDNSSELEFIDKLKLNSPEDSSDFSDIQTGLDEALHTSNESKDLFDQNDNLQTSQYDVSSIESVPSNSLPTDLQAMLGEEFDRDIHTNPLEDEAPVSATFTPSGFFDSADFQLDEPAAVSIPSDKTEDDGEIEISDIALENQKVTPLEDMKPSVKPELNETGPVIPLDEIAPLEIPQESERTEIENVIIPEIEQVQSLDLANAIIFSVDERKLEEAEPEITETEASTITLDESVEAGLKVIEPVSLLDETVEETIGQPVQDLFTPKAVEPIVQTPPILVEPIKPKEKIKPEKPAEPVKKAARLQAVVKPVRRVQKPQPTPQPPVKPTAGSTDLLKARESISRGDLISGLRKYIKLVNSNKSLDQVSSDLKDIVKKNPKNYLAWQTYGDARLRSNKIQEALDAYAKAADLLK